SEESPETFASRHRLIDAHRTRCTQLPVDIGWNAAAVEIGTAEIGIRTRSHALLLLNVVMMNSPEVSAAPEWLSTLHDHMPHYDSV
ncbi:MAG TPA: hypothetical protein PKC08_09365, partial [Pseudomonadales bacterium]|nr:hypothetical protein [Pseudomonadales bacterium]